MNDEKIPYVIHYCWFGGKEKPESVKRCINSWKEKCPQFRIVEWNETNYDLHSHPFMEKAYSLGKWAFVTDYVRLDILNREGGIYLDTDVEVLKDLSPLCENRAFIGFERTDLVNDGQGFGGVKGFELFEEMLALYEKLDEFVESPKLRTQVLLKHGLIPDGTMQVVDGMTVYPMEYFCAKNYRTGIIKITENSYSIHHFDGSWHGKASRKYTKYMHICCRLWGEEVGMKVFEKTMELKDSIRGK